FLSVKKMWRISVAAIAGSALATACASSYALAADQVSFAINLNEGFGPITDISLFTSSHDMSRGGSGGRFTLSAEKNVLSILRNEKYQEEAFLVGRTQDELKGFHLVLFVNEDVAPRIDGRLWEQVFPALTEADVLAWVTPHDMDSF